MAPIHDAAVRTDLERRLESLSATSRGRWGTMTVDQMLWHCNQSIRVSLGDLKLGPARPPLPPRILKFVALRLPWFKGMPTHHDLVARSQYDFDGERARLLALIETTVRRPLESEWPAHPAFGSMTGREVSQLLAKHLDHHFKQFGA